MKRFIPTILFFLVSVLWSQVPAEYQYQNQTMGIAARIPADWQVFQADGPAVPAFFKEMLKAKATPDASPLFLGINKQQSGFVRCLHEPFDGAIDEYAELLLGVIESQGMEVISASYTPDGESAILQYRVYNGEVPIDFMEMITIHEGSAIRLSWWAMKALYPKLLPVFRTFAETILFRTDAAQGSWSALWKGQVQLDQETPAAATYSNDRFFFFPVQGKTNKVYLMGSIHVGKNNFYPFSKAIEDAFAASPNLVVEVDMKSQANQDASARLQELGSLPAGTTLKTVLGKDLHAALETAFKPLGVPMDSLQSYKPWLVASTLTVLKMMSLGYTAESGVEAYFTDRAKGKRILELETIAEQTQALDRIDGKAFLAVTLASLATMERDMDSMIRAWKAGDQTAMDKLLNDYDSTMVSADQEAGFNKIMLLERNQKMAARIKPLLNDSQDYFIVVGAAHLSGKDSIQNLLAKDGYRVLP